MKNLLKYSDFKTNEAKKIKSDLELFMKDLKNLLEDMFAKTNNLEYEYGDDEFPTELKFKANDGDFNINYKDAVKVEIDSEIVLNKRNFIPELIFKSKDDKTNELVFKIKKSKVKKNEGVEFTNDELNGENGKKNLKNNENFTPNDIERFDEFDTLEKQTDDEIIEQPINSNTEPIIEQPIVNEPVIEQPIMTEPVLTVTKCSCNCTDNTIDNEYFEEENEKPIHLMTWEEKFKYFQNKDRFNGHNLTQDAPTEMTSEGLIGKIAKFLSKGEYNKTLEYVLDNCKEECTLEDVKKTMKGMIFSKITKDALKEDSKMMDSLAEEIYKDVKKEMKKNESLYKIVNDTLKIKKFDEIDGLNEAFKNVYKNNDNNILKTISK